MKGTLSELHRRGSDVQRKGWTNNFLHFLIDSLWRDEIWVKKLIFLFVPLAQKQADWNQITNTEPDFIKNKPATYTLPTATSSVLGGIKLGTGLNIDENGVVSVVSTFLELEDVVDETYIGKAWNIPKVTDTEDGLELAETEELELIDAKFTELLDCPNSYTGYEGYLVRVRLDGTGLEFVAP